MATKKKTAPAIEAFKNRIVGEDDVDPRKLVANPANWRKHPEEQHAALSALLRDVGWVGRVVVNKRTGLILDGHLRVELAVSQGEPHVPVMFVDLSEAEERKVLALLDPIGDLAKADPGKLAALITQIPKGDALSDIIRSIASQNIPKPTPPSKSTAHGLTNEKFEHHLAFDDGAQLERFHAFLRRLRDEYPEILTVGARLDRFLAERTEA